MPFVKSYFYYNLHKERWSQMIRGLVVSHLDAVKLRDVEFRVRPGGRARVLREGRKNVHAFAVSRSHEHIWVGHPNPLEGPNGRKGWIEIGYNPYRDVQFIRKDTGAHVYHAARVVLTDDRKVFAKID